jgi:aconitate hydratase
MDLDLGNDPLGHDARGQPVFLSDLWPSAQEVAQTVEASVDPDMFRRAYAGIFDGDHRWQALDAPTGSTFAWDPASTYVRRPPHLDGMPAGPLPVADIAGARVLVKLGDSITTDHISPAGAIPRDSDAGRYLASLGVPPRQLNTFASRRGNHEVMVRGAFANLRLRNQLAAGTVGGVTRCLDAGGAVMSIYQAATTYEEHGTPVVVIAGKDYGAGSLPRLGGQGSKAARRPRHPRRVLRTHPPLQPRRHGHPAPAVPPWPVGPVARPDR